jgi:hypothetical protein
MESAIDVIRNVICDIKGDTEAILEGDIDVIDRPVIDI